VNVRSTPHGQNGVFNLPKLTIDLQNPQNTKITVGATQRTLTDISSQRESDVIQRVEVATKNIQANNSEVSVLAGRVETQTTEVINTCNQIILSALESYVETSNFEQFKETVSAQLDILASEIIMNFTSTTESIDNVNGDLQMKFTELHKHISFSENGIRLGSNESAITLEIDNDMILFKKNGVQFGWWDGVDFHTGNIVVEVNERAQFGNFAFIPRSDGSLMFLKVGG
jgi:hypothetical protein